MIFSSAVVLWAQKNWFSTLDLFFTPVLLLASVDFFLVVQTLEE